MSDAETNLAWSFSDDTHSGFTLPDLYLSDEWMDDDLVSAVSGMSNSYGYQISDHDAHASSVLFSGSSSSFIHPTSPSSISSVAAATTTASPEGNQIKKEKKKVKERVAFKTKSDVEVLEDGFKWRKYGKKMVKNSPHPRNYYKCAADSCPVKKRVERDRDDPSFVITTYEGSHNHTSMY
ncbi:unnamed protein product [Eruca vesicaria subsp. sativa]|uniref:WRKY domain-containing protein n=1 Tax=Eruca vesicaria subsp. sativa TaxID=29727 RepID=A0ABC8LEV3_ERUVS|nr:unnamed protein product [Eruca vesicaria subsp. sativa]